MRKKLVVLLAAFMLFIVPATAFATGRTVNVTDAAGFIAALNDQQDGDIITLAAGTYDIGKGANTLSAGGQTGWYIPVVKNDVTIEGAGVGQTTVTSTDVSANGVWSSQDFFAIFGDRVAIKNMTIVPKVETNKAIEIMGKDVTLEGLSIESNPLNNDPAHVVGGAGSDELGTDATAKFSGSIYFNPAGSPDADAAAAKDVGTATVKDVSLQAHISTGGATGVQVGAINLDGVTIDHTNFPYDAWDLRTDGWGVISNNPNLVVAAGGLTVLVDEEDINYTRDVLSLVPTNTVVSFAPGTYDLGSGTVTRPITLKGDATGNTFFETGNVTVSGDGALTPVNGTIVVHPTGIALPAAKTVALGSSFTAVPTFTPADTTDKSVKWESDNAAVATVDANGLVKAIALGTANIKVTSVDGSLTASMAVTVVKPTAASLTLNRTALRTKIGARTTLVATIAPANADSTAVTWKSSDPTIAYVSSAGVVLGKRPGVVTITAKSVSNPALVKTVRVRVYRPVTKITAPKTRLTLRRGTSWKLRAKAYPLSATNRALVYKANTKNLTFKKGIVYVAKRAVHNARYVITVKARDGFGAFLKIVVRITKYFPRS